MKKYKCYYCDSAFDVHKDVVDHLVDSHNSFNVRYRELELNDETGRHGYRTKAYDIVPADGEVFVTADERIGVYRDDRSKKTKFNTPLKEDHLTINTNQLDRDEFEASSNDLTSLLSEMDIGTLIKETDTESDDMAEMLEILPIVLEHLKESGHLESYKKWCNLIADKKIPMNNISFLLFLDTVEWFSSSSTSEMRYVRPETKRFWEVGYRLFRGKFLRFMSGPRNVGQVVDGTEGKGECLSSASQINFAVPTLKTLCKDKLDPIMPGVMEKSIESIAHCMPSKLIKIGVDGKKIARGKGKLMGDIDCWGFEQEPTLRKRIDRNVEEQNTVSKLFTSVKELDEKGHMFIPSLDSHVINQKLISLITVISNRIKDLRGIAVRLELGIEKFMNLGDCLSKHWTKSKFAPVISSLKVAKYDTDSSIEYALRLINDICKISATFSGKQNLYASKGIVDMSEQENFHQLKANVQSNDTRLIKQKSEKWFEVRSKAMVTGSTCNTALGLGLLKQQQAHFDKVVNRKEDTTVFSDQQKSNMEYGSVHEIDGVATIVGRVLPAIYPNLDYYEEGCARISNKDNESFLVASPDGSFRASTNTEPTIMFENKCKVKSKYTTPVFYDIPKYYIPQLLCEMAAYKCDSLLFSCWSKQSTTVFQVKFDEDLWQIIWEQLDQLYGSERPKRPTKFPEINKDIRSMISEYQQKKVSFVGEFPSCTVKTPPEEEEYATGGPYITNTKQQPVESDDGVETETLLSVLRRLEKWFDEVYQLCRTSATEILMFMANDLDRKFHVEINNAHPVAYALKGSSMTNDVFKLMIETVIKKCEETGLTVIATSSDGQWHKYGVRGSTGLPLTMYQLQKDMWKEEKSKSKSTLLKEIRNRYKVSSPQDVLIEKQDKGALVVLGHKRESPLRVYSSTIDKWQLKLDLPVQIEGGSDIIETGEENNTLTLLKSFVTEHDFEEDINSEISTMAPTNTTEPNAVMDLHLGEFMTMMFSDTVMDNDDYNNVSVTGEQVHANNNLRQNFVSAVNQMNQSLPVPDLNTNSQESYCTNENDTSISTVVGHASAALCGNADNENVGEIRNNSLAGDEMETSINMSENEINDVLNDSDAMRDAQSTYDGKNPVENKDLNGDCKEILNSLRQCDSNRKPFWEATSVETLCMTLNDKNKTFKTLQKKEMMLCLDTLKKQRNKNFMYFISWNKTKLNDTLSNAWHNVCEHDSADDNHKDKRRKYSPPKLSKIVSKFLNKIPKETLVVTLCENNWPEYFDTWSTQSSVKNNDALIGCKHRKWFSQPSVGESGNPCFHFNDSCHILTCLRTKICTTGISGLCKVAWEKAAESKQTQLNIAIVNECIDKQSVAFAKRVFGEDVELFMKSMSYDNEARFVHLVRRWFEAEDEPGVSVLERCLRRLELRDYLLENVNFGSFPPKTQYVKGIPIITYESLLVHIERKLQIFEFLPERCYNPRALGTQEVEQFFSTLRDLDPSGLGTPKPDDIPDMMAAAAFLDNVRMDPDRSFYMRTSRAQVYPDNSMHLTETAEDIHDTPLNTFGCRDHFFDTTHRKRGKQKRKSGNVSVPDQPARGQRGVRQYHACDESKLLAHIRKGLTDL